MSHEIFPAQKFRRFRLTTPILLGYFIRPMGFIAKKELQKTPILQRWMQILDCIYIDRKNPRSAAETIRHAAQFIRQQKACISIFPEGTRSVSDLTRFKKGSFKLAYLADAYIVPVAIRGTKYISSGDNINAGYIARIDMIIGRPIDVSQLTLAQKEQLPLQVEDWVRWQLSHTSNLNDEILHAGG